jgi:hypothetical protein
MAFADDWTLQDATKAVADAQAASLDPGKFPVIKKMVEARDFFQNGSQWAGPTGANDVARGRILTQVEPKFTPIDAIGETLDRSVSALLKVEADVQLVPREPVPDLDAEAASDDATRLAHEEAVALQDEAADQVRATLAGWWDRVRLWEVTWDAVRRSRWAGRGHLRLWVPKGRLRTTTATNGEGEEVTVIGLPTGLGFEEALDQLELMAPCPEHAAVIVDPDTQERAAVFLFTTPDGQQSAEVWTLDADGTVRVRMIGEQTSEVPLDVAGHLPIAEMTAPLLVTEPVRRLQNQLNYFQSLLGRTAETAGFPERYLLNAEAQGDWTSVDPGAGNYVDTKNKEGVTWYLVPSDRTLGAGTTVEPRGFEYDTDANGGKGITTPSVTFKEPTDPEFVLKCIRATYAALIRQAKQAHILRSAEADMSGEAQQQARADFEDDLTAVKPQVEGMLRSTLEAVIAFAGAMSEDAAGLLDTYRVAVNLRVDTGPLSADEQRAINERVAQGTLSLETALARLGEEDVDAEVERLRQDPKAKAAVAVAKANAVKAWMDAGLGLSLEDAAELAGLEPDEVALLRKVRAPKPEAGTVPGVNGTVVQ